MKTLKEFIVYEGDVEQTSLSKEITYICGGGVSDNTVFAINDWISNNSVVSVKAYTLTKNKEYINDDNMLTNINFSDSITAQMQHDYNLNTSPQNIGDGIFAIPDMLKVNKPHEVSIYIKANRGI